MSDKESPIGEVLIKNVRLSFADIYKPGKESKNDKGETVPGRYKANGLMEKDTPDTIRNLKLLKAAREAVAEAKWGKNQPKIKPDKLCVRDGDLEDYDGYANHWYISASESEKPQLITRQKDEDGNWMEAPPGKLYSGCYVNMLVVLWAQDNEYGKRINARLKVVQFHKAGEAFGSGGPVDVNKKFADIEEDDDDDTYTRSSSSRSTDDDDDAESVI